MQVRYFFLLIGLVAIIIHNSSLSIGGNTEFFKDFCMSGWIVMTSHDIEVEGLEILLESRMRTIKFRVLANLNERDAHALVF